MSLSDQLPYGRLGSRLVDLALESILQFLTLQDIDNLLIADPKLKEILYAVETRFYQSYSFIRRRKLQEEGINVGSQDGHAARPDDFLVNDLVYIGDRMAHYTRMRDYYIALFSKACAEKLRVRITEEADITIDVFEIEPGGCHGCGVQWDTMYLKGHMFATQPDDEDYGKTLEYFARMKADGILCKCAGEYETFVETWDVPEYLFDGYIENNPPRCLYRYFLTTDEVCVSSESSI